MCTQQNNQFTQEQLNIINEYCNCNLLKLRQLCFPLIKRIGGISQADYDDFIDIALSTLLDSVMRYRNDMGCKFYTFLYSNIKRKYASEIRDRNVKKRIPSKQLISIDAEGFVETDELMVTEDVSYKKILNDYIEHGSKAEKYLLELSTVQRKIVLMLMDGYNAESIKAHLHIDTQQYLSELRIIRSYEFTRILI